MESYLTMCELKYVMWLEHETLHMMLNMIWHYMIWDDMLWDETTSDKYD